MLLSLVLAIDSRLLPSLDLSLGRTSCKADTAVTYLQWLEDGRYRIRTYDLTGVIKLHLECPEDNRVVSRLQRST
jgi:hypothetical protein